MAGDVEEVRAAQVLVALPEAGVQGGGGGADLGRDLPVAVDARRTLQVPELAADLGPAPEVPDPELQP
jgi:hypothetical protein